MIPQCCNTTSNFSPVTHVIFDLDGTLIDSEEVYGEALQTTVKSYGIDEYPSDFQKKVAGSVQQDAAKVAIETFNLDTTVEEFLKLYNDYANERLGNLDLMPGADKLVKHLYNNKVPIAIATSSEQEAFELKTKKYADLFSLFGHVVCGGTDPEVKNGKPAPDIFLTCASRFSDSPDPSKCLVFEDSGNGVKGAVAAGMQVVMTPDKAVLYEVWKLATQRLDSLEYMMPQLFGLPPFPPGEILFPDDILNKSGNPTNTLQIKGDTPAEEIADN